MAYLKVVNENGTKRLIDYSKAPQYNKLAVNEPTTTASQSYAKGEYLTQGGYFKKVTNAIASGDTISSSNTEDTTVGAELTEINEGLTELNTNLSELLTPTQLYSRADDTVAPLSEPITNFYYLLITCKLNWVRGSTLIPVSSNVSDMLTGYQITYVYGEGARYGSVILDSVSTAHCDTYYQGAVMTIYGVGRRN